MSAAVTLDTLAFVRRLENKGVKSDQAEEIVGIVKDAFQAADDHAKELATKADVEIAIEKAKNEILKWFVGGIAAQMFGLGFLILRATGKA